MIELLVNLVEFHPHFSQRGNEFLSSVGGFFLGHELSNTQSLKRLAAIRFGNRDLDHFSYFRRKEGCPLDAIGMPRTFCGALTQETKPSRHPQHGFCEPELLFKISEERNQSAADVGFF